MTDSNSCGQKVLFKPIKVSFMNRFGEHHLKDYACLLGEMHWDFKKSFLQHVQEVY